MVVYRITLEKWSSNLTASGFPARWNSKGKFMIYTAGSRALACLENVVHRSGEGLNLHFKVMLIEVPESLKMDTIESKDLPENWHHYTSSNFTQQIGDAWLATGSSAVLRVPSAIIFSEYN